MFIYFIFCTNSLQTLGREHEELGDKLSDEVFQVFEKRESSFLQQGFDFFQFSSHCLTNEVLHFVVWDQSDQEVEFIQFLQNSVDHWKGNNQCTFR